MLPSPVPRSAPSSICSRTIRDVISTAAKASIGDLQPGEEATVVGEVRSSRTRQLRGRRTLTEVVIGDGGHQLRLTFFNQRWREKQLTPGMSVLVHGKCDTFQGQRQMTSPIVDLVGDQTGRIIAVYPQSEKSGLLTKDLARFVEEAVARCRPRPRRPRS